MKKIKRNMLTLLVILICSFAIMFGCNSSDYNIEQTVDLEQICTEISSDTSEIISESNVINSEFSGGEWYLSEWEKYPKLPNKEIDESLQNIYMKCPLAYEEISDGVKIRVEFFVESYQMYSFIQTRLTYTNQTDDKIVFDANHPETLGAFKKNDRVILNPKNSKNNNYINTDAVINITLESGESFTDEVVFFMTGNFDLESGYTYTAKIYQYSSTEETKIYGITIPIEVYRAE